MTPSLELDLRCCPVTALHQREARTTTANVTSYWIGNLIQMEFLGNPLGVATSLIDPLCSGAAGSRLLKEVTVHEQAPGCDSGSPAASISITPDGVFLCC